MHACSDDGSSDTTAQTADIGDPRCRVITLARNSGKAIALDTALHSVATPITVLIICETMPTVSEMRAPWSTRL